MTVRLVGMIIGVLVAGFYAIQLQRLASGRANPAAAANPATSRVIAIAGLIIGLGVAAWWYFG
jgi:hypothetical protein